MKLRGFALLVIVAIATSTAVVLAQDLRGKSAAKLKRMSSPQEAHHQNTVHGMDLQAILHKTMANQQQKKQQKRALIKADTFKNGDADINYNNAGPGEELQFFAVRTHTHTRVLVLGV
jgi:hypothetical protein